MTSTFIFAAAAPVIKGPLAYFVTPFFGIVLSIAVYLLGQWLFKIGKLQL